MTADLIPVPRRLIRQVLLRDGSALLLRAPVRADLDAIEAFFDRLSPESRYLRFHGYRRTDKTAREYADADGLIRVALIGVEGDRVVAAGAYERIAGHQLAEVALAVADDYQGRGIGTALLDELAAIAAKQGLRRLEGKVLSANHRMLGLFRRAGFDLRRRRVSGEVTASLDLRGSEAVEDTIAA